MGPVTHGGLLVIGDSLSVGRTEPYMGRVLARWPRLHGGLACFGRRGLVVLDGRGFHNGVFLCCRNGAVYWLG